MNRHWNLSQMASTVLLALCAAQAAFGFVVMYLWAFGALHVREEVFVVLFVGIVATGFTGAMIRDFS